MTCCSMRTLSAAAVQQLGVSSSQRLSRSDSGSAPKATQDRWSPRPGSGRRSSPVGQRTAPACRAHQSPKAKSKASQRPDGHANPRKRGATLRGGTDKSKRKPAPRRGSLKPAKARCCDCSIVEPPAKSHDNPDDHPWEKQDTMVSSVWLWWVLSAEIAKNGL